jgi:hypothetical protein
MPDLEAKTPEPALRMRLTGGIDTPFFGCFSFLLGIMGAGIGPLVIALGARLLDIYPSGQTVALAGLGSFVAITALMLWRTVFTYISVGADGVVIRRRFKTEFVPYRDIVHTNVGWSDLVFALRDGSTAKVRVDTLPPLKRDYLFARIEAQRTAYRVARGDDAVLEVLDRRDRSLTAWREALAKLLHRSDGYREASLSQDDVLAVLANVSARPERRIGAALALTAQGEPDARSRVRVVASECADRRVRVALESIADGDPDDEAMREAMEADPGEEVSQAPPVL